MKQTKTATGHQEPKTPRIKHLFGTNRILVIAPHGVKGNDNYTDIIAEQLHQNLGCFAVINTGFRRPDEDKGETSDPKIPLLDLGKINDGDHLRRPHKGIPHDEDFLGWIDSFLAEIAMNHGELLLVHIHGIDTENIREVASKTSYKKKPNDLHVLVGYGQRNAKKKQSLTASKKIVDDLIKNLSGEKINAIDSPPDSIDINGKRRRYCGSDPDVLNQYLRSKGIKGQSIQLEIRELDFRDNPEITRKAADTIGKAIGLVAGCIPPAQKETQVEKAGELTMSVAAPAPIADTKVRTTLSEKSEERRIRVNEINLSDTRFKSRVSEYGVDQESLNELMASIMGPEGILNNIIVRKGSGKAKYQLISGFRRLAALEKGYKEQGREQEFLKAEVPAKIFKSITDEEALRISFSENLDRKDLTLWELSNHCRMIAEELTKQGKSQGEIETYLADLIRKDDRTVRRYLALSAIRNESIRRDLHNGTMDASIGSVFNRQGLTEKGRDALYRLYKRSPNPPSFDSFDRLARNALKLSEWSGLKLEKILGIRAALDFLTIPPDELKERAEYLMKTRNKPLEVILAHEITDLKNSIDRVRSRDEMAPFNKRFSEKASVIHARISEALKTKDVNAEVMISPIGVLKDQMVKLTVAAPVADMQKVVQITLAELKNESASLEGLFKRPPKPSPRKEEIRAKKRVKVDNNAAIAFSMPLKRLQDILKDLARDGSLSSDRDDPKGQILVRASSDNKLEFGRHCNNGLLIPSEAEIHQKGSSVLRLKDIYAPIANLGAKKDTACEIQIVPLPVKSSPAESAFSLKIQEMSWKWDIPSYEPDELNKWFDMSRRAKTTVEMEADDLNGMLRKVLPCINPADIRLPLTGVLFNMDKDGLTLTGSNGVKLYEVANRHRGLKGPVQQVLPHYGACNLLRGLIKKDTGVLIIGVSDETILFLSDHFTLIGSLITGVHYPNYHAEFRKADNSFKIPISKLREMGDSMGWITDPEDNQRMTICTGDGYVLFGNKKGKTKCLTKDIKGKIDIDVNAGFLVDLAKSMDGEIVEVRQPNGSPLITLHPDNGDQRALLTILRIREEEPKKVESAIPAKKPEGEVLENRRVDNTKEMPESAVKSAFGTREWAVKSVNCCDGCSHDCLYCYAKEMASRNGRIPIDQWKAERIRQKDVDKKHRLYDGRVMFPSSHDITPRNLDACSTVVRNLLLPGNQLLIVSKPHLECIKAICKEFGNYKNQMTFRFTISATDDRVLSFWEPNAPNYQERNECLKYAFKAGFRTSVSVEPMLDPERIDDLVRDLSRYVNDAIWIGKMNHLGRIPTGGDGVKERIGRIKAGQTDDKITAIYEKYKDNPKIKWKESIKKVVGIPPVEKPGMDV
jgi:DNA polymerase III sliding clamp (beta) subunit (PCNA family)